jgi:hypothetical protein
MEMFVVELYRLDEDYQSEYKFILCWNQDEAEDHINSSKPHWQSTRLHRSVNDCLLASYSLEMRFAAIRLRAIADALEEEVRWQHEATGAEVDTHN